MDVKTFETPAEMGKAAATEGAVAIRAAIAERGEARIIVATGASQFEVFKSLVDQPEIDWSKVTGFHLDEYIGLPITHPASFRKYLKERFVDKVPLAEFHYISGEDDAEAECERVREALAAAPIDVAFVGIGENGHLAFNDPPADFDVETPYIVVNLDEACRQQQFGEGWFPTFEAVPQKAISMSVRQIMKSRKIVCSVPDERKSEAVKNTVQGDVTPDVPASILQNHADITLYLDEAAASQL